MKKALRIILMLALIGIFIGILSIDGSEATKEAVQIEQVGYSKHDRQRVMTFNYHYADSCSNTFIENKLRDHGARQSHTAGKMTQVFYFTDSVAPDITMMGTNQALIYLESHEPPADYLFYHLPDGSQGLQKL